MPIGCSIDELVEELVDELVDGSVIRPFGGPMQRTSSSTNPRLKQQASLLIIDLGLLIIDFSLPLPCQDFYTILLSPCELDFTMKTILQSPIWAQRVIYIRGECISLVGISLVGHLLGIVRPSRFNI